MPHSKLALLNSRTILLIQKCRHFDEIFITGYTGSCLFDNFQCNQWWKLHQNEDIIVSVMNTKSTVLTTYQHLLIMALYFLFRHPVTPKSKIAVRSHREILTKPANWLFDAIYCLSEDHWKLKRNYIFSIGEWLRRVRERVRKLYLTSDSVKRIKLALT